MEAHKDSSESKDLLALEVKLHNCAVAPESVAPGLLHGGEGMSSNLLPGQLLLPFSVPLDFLKFKFEKAWMLAASLIPCARQS